MHNYPGFHADDLTFATVGHEIWIINIKTKEHVRVANVTVRFVPQLTVDPKEELIYWCDNTLRTISSAKWDGTNRRVIRKPKKSKCLCVGVCFNQSEWFLNLCWNSIIHIAFRHASIHF